MFCCADETSAQRKSDAAAATIRFLISHLLESTEAYHRADAAAV